MNINLNDIGAVSIRCLLSLITLFAITKLLGKKQVAQLSLFDYVIGISIGNFAAEISLNLEANIIYGLLAVIIFGLFSYIISILSMKSIFIRRTFMGTPTVLIENGKIAINGLKKAKLDINDLMEQARGVGYFDISEIEYAIIEVNGKISFLPKGENKPLTVKDMNIKANKQGVFANVVIDSKIMKENIKLMGKDEKWLNKELKNKGYKNLDKILLVTLDINEKIVVYEKTTIKNHNVLE